MSYTAENILNLTAGWLNEPLVNDSIHGISAATLLLRIGQAARKVQTDVIRNSDEPLWVEANKITYDANSRYVDLAGKVAAVGTNTTIHTVRSISWLNSNAVPSASNPLVMMGYQDYMRQEPRLGPGMITFEGTVIQGPVYKYYIMNESELYLNPIPTSDQYLWIEWVYELEDPTQLSDTVWSYRTQMVDMVAIQLAMFIKLQRGARTTKLEKAYSNMMEEMVDRRQFTDIKRRNYTDNIGSL